MPWTVRLHTFPEDQVDAMLEYCHDAGSKDPTFKWEEQGTDGKLKYIIIQCETKDHAYRRGTLFHHRFGCFFEVEWVAKET